MTQLELVDGVLRGETFLAALKGARVTVIGLARQTCAAASLLHEAGARVRVEPVFTDADLTGEDLVVVTAAAAVEAPAVIAARARGVRILGELDLGWCATEAETLAFVGGSGASTAVRLVGAVLARHGRAILTAGGDHPNLSESARGFSADGLILVALSAAQIATAQLFRPRVLVVLPEPEDRASDILPVRPDLAALLALLTPRDLIIAESDHARALGKQARARVLSCSEAGALDHGVYVERGRIAARLNGHVEEICPVEGLPRAVIPAALAAAACALWAGMAPGAIGDVLSGGRLAPVVHPVMSDAAALVAPIDLWTRRTAALVTG